MIGSTERKEELNQYPEGPNHANQSEILYDPLAPPSDEDDIDGSLDNPDQDERVSGIVYNVFNGIKSWWYRDTSEENAGKIESDDDIDDEVEFEVSPPQTTDATPGRFNGAMRAVGVAIGKTYNVGKSLTGWAGNQTMSVGIVREATKRFIGNHPYVDDLEAYKAELSGMRGTGHLTELIEMLRPRIVEKVLDKLENHPMIPSNLIQRERQYFSDMISAFIFKAITGLMRNAIKEFQDDNPEVEYNAVSVLFESLLDKLFGEFDKIDREVFQDNQKLPKEIGEQRNSQLFRSATEVLLRQAFPQGSAELIGLGRTIRWVIWGTITDDIVPNLLASVYKFINFPDHETPDDTEILEKKGGIPVKAIARSSAILIREITPEAIGKGSEKLAKIIFEKLSDTPIPEANEQWLADTLKNVALSESPSVLRVWEILEEIANSLLCHGLATVAKVEGEERADRNIVTDIVKRLLDVFIDFLEENREAIDLDIERLKNDHNRELVDDELMEHFVPLTNKILEMADLSDDPIVHLVKPTLIPKFFLDSYRDMINFQGDIQDFHKRLQRKLFDDREFLNRPINERNENLRVAVEGVAQQRNVEDVVLDLAGVKQHADDLSAMCGVFAEDIRAITERYVKNNTLTIVELIRKDLVPEEQGALAEGIQDVLNDPENPKIMAVFDYSQTLMNATMFKLLVAVIENTPLEPHLPQAGNRNGNLVANITHRLFTMLGEKVPEIQEGIALINATDESDENKKKEIVNLFQPLALDLLNLAGEDWMDLLPIPVDLKISLAELLEEDLLPSLLNLVYTEMYGWVSETDAMEHEVDDTFGSTGSKHAISAFSNYIEDYIPYFLELNPEKVVNLLGHTGEKYIQHMSEAQKNTMHRMMVRNIKIIGKDQANGTVWKACAAYSKAIILKMVEGISKEISMNERVKGIQGESSFLLTTAVKALEVTKDHFVSLSNIPEEGRTSPAHTVKHSEILVGFNKGEILHPALAIDAAGSLEDRANRRLECFYKPLARDLIELAGIGNPTEFPIPSGIREEMFELFKEDILPEILMNIFNDMLEPRNINKSMLTLIDRLNSTIEGLEDDHYIENDVHQKALNETCGDIIKSMVNLVPEIFTKTFFPADKIKEMSAEYVGGLVRRKLQKTNMLELMDSILTSSNLPDPRQKEWRDYRAQVSEDRKIQKELIKKLTAYISKQVKETLKETIHKKWDSFQASFDRTVEKFAGKPGLAVKKFLDFIFSFIVFKILGPIFEFLFYKILWFFVDLIIVRKAIEIINDSQMKIHENLIFNLTDSYMTIMKVAKDSRREEDLDATPDVVGDEHVNLFEDDDGLNIHNPPVDVVEGFIELEDNHVNPRTPKEQKTLFTRTRSLSNVNF